MDLSPLIIRTTYKICAVSIIGKTFGQEQVFVARLWGVRSIQNWMERQQSIDLWEQGATRWCLVTITPWHHGQLWPKWSLAGGLAGWDKKVIKRNILRTVKWFNVRNVHGSTAKGMTSNCHKQNNPKKDLHRRKDGEKVEFDVVEGEKGYGSNRC